MGNEKKMDADFKIRCFIEEKELLKKSAEEVGLNMSDFVRSLIFSKEKLVLLSEGADIAKALFLLHNDLEYFHNNGGVPTESLNAMLSALNDVATKLNVVASKLTDIHKEYDDNE